MIKPGATTVQNELDQFITRRNEAAHSDVNDIVASDEVKQTGDFSHHLGNALADILTYTLLKREMDAYRVLYLGLRPSDVHHQFHGRLGHGLRPGRLASPQVLPQTRMTTLHHPKPNRDREGAATSSSCESFSRTKLDLMPVSPQTPFAVTMIGGGMIAQDQILPSLYQLQRLGQAGEITVCAQRASTLEALAANEGIRNAFPGHSFRAIPNPDPTGYRQAIAAMPPRQLLIAAVPDQLHFDVVMTALRANQHVIAVKPLVLTMRDAAEIEREAKARELFVGVEYHKRFDDRSLLARRRYRAGMFGEFKLGTARLMEKWYYRHSNFQNWFTTDNSDAFTYIGCHYVDFVHFVTGLLPTAVSVYGIKDKFPNGNEGYLWSDARVLWSNGACLNVQNSLSFPDDAPGTNTQGITMYFSDGERGAWLDHSDQYRGIKYCYTHKPDSPGATVFAEPSTEYFQYVDLGGPGLKPIGYGYRSIEFLVQCAARVESAADKAGVLREIDEAGVAATPFNSSYNEGVMEAGRLSILNGGRVVEIGPSGVRFRE